MEREVDLVYGYPILLLPVVDAGDGKPEVVTSCLHPPSLPSPGRGGQTKFNSMFWYFGFRFKSIFITFPAAFFQTCSKVTRQSKYMPHSVHLYFGLHDSAQPDSNNSTIPTTITIVVDSLSKGVVFGTEIYTHSGVPSFSLSLSISFFHYACHAM